MVQPQSNGRVPPDNPPAQRSNSTGRQGLNTAQGTDYGGRRHTRRESADAPSQQHRKIRRRDGFSSQLRKHARLFVKSLLSTCVQMRLRQFTSSFRSPHGCNATATRRHGRSFTRARTSLHLRRGRCISLRRYTVSSKTSTGTWASV